ncbi:MAG: endolytic transglycosylase MltG [Patescibacteria group bacterium]
MRFMKAWGILLLLLGGGSALISYYLFIPRSLNGALTTVSIAQGSSLDEAADKLARAGVISNAMLFRIFFSAVYPGATVKAGEYQVRTPHTIPSAARLLVIGAPKRERAVTIIEGWSLKDIQSTGIDLTALTAKDFSGAFEFLRARASDQSLEGYVFPDTYRLYEDASPRDLAEKALANFVRKFSQSLQNTAREQGRSIHEVVTLASIIEREVRNDEDRALVSDIFIRRLKKGMPLQVDSTVNYITGKSSPSASADDISRESPYNTYRVAGLPPGPICNPSLSSLRAALYPKKNTYWYFLTPPDGTVIYGRTFDEHIANKRKYL